MIEMTTAAGFTDETFDRFVESRNEPGWLVDHRRSAWDIYKTLPWPSRREEEWTRTDIRLFKLDRFGLPIDGELKQPAGEALLADGVQLGGKSASINSRSIELSLDARWSDQGVLFGSLSQLASEHPELIQEILGRRQLKAGKDRFAALNNACWSNGNVLYVPRGVMLDAPLHLHAMIADGGVDLSHTVIVLEEGAAATVLSESSSENAESDGFHCGSVEMMLAGGANLRYVNLQNWSHNTWHFSHQSAQLGQDASLQWTVGAIGSRLSKVNQQVRLAGPGANCQVNGVLFTEGKQHLSYHTLQHHQAPNCHSDFLYKAALQDRSRTIWRGMIEVDPVAQQTNGYQRNDNLLLSNQARADSIPGLEIEADDVRCTHGATTGKVDEELIFYATCRGFTRLEATRLVVCGFFQQVIDRITIDSVREALTQAIGRRVRDYA